MSDINITPEAAEAPPISATAKPVTKSAWKKAAIHTVTLPSSAVVKIKLPDLAGLIEAGNIPSHLTAAALSTLKQVNAGEETETSIDDIIKEREFTDVLVQYTVVEPKLDADDLDEIPVEDKTMIVEFAVRVRDLDAEWNHIGGLDKISERFRQVRGLASLDEAVEGV
jgi:hypothetical protein